MDTIPAWFIFIIIPSFSLGLAPDSENADNTKLYEAMKIENIAKVHGPDAVTNATIYDEEWGTKIPESLRKKDNNSVQFYLVSSRKPRWIDINDTKETISEAEFDKNAPTKIICHGFKSNCTEGPGKLLLKAYRKAYKHVNIILVDWEHMAKEFMDPPKENTYYSRPYFYQVPAGRTERVGNETGALIKFLVNKTGVSLSNIHLIGHSLGAHAMGWAGLAVHNDFKEKVGRITGLDPAGPCFVQLDHCIEGNYRVMKKSDALFVDAIHTNAGNNGMEKAVGHADFYPNGGSVQPDCDDFPYGTCSHDRAIQHMADSVEFGRIEKVKRYLEGKKCASWDDYNEGLCKRAPTSELGEFCPVQSHGKYYLKIKPLSHHHHHH